MFENYLPYVVTEIFCILCSAAILIRLWEGIGREPEIIALQKMIAAYIVLMVTDVLGTLSDTAFIVLPYYVNAALDAVMVTSVAAGCYYWYCFVEIRLVPVTETGRTGLYKAVSRIPLAFICIMDMSSMFTGWIFYIDADGFYETGPLFMMQRVITFSYLLFPTFHAAYVAVRTSSPKKRKECLTYIAYIIVPFVIVAVEDCFETVPLLELSIFMVIQILFLTIYLDREYELARKEVELSESRTAVLLSQIKPHFLYNTLLVIQDMCHGKAPDAEQTTVEFAEFLRGNIDSLNRTEPIPFEMELRHTQLYLTLEQKRFGERLKVQYDIQATGFMIPALTLQPIVENAVRHGVSVKADGGTVMIATCETESSFRITVSDDGAGFDVSTVLNDGQEHIGIRNVRSRLETICGGSLEIYSVPGKGTTAEITVPRMQSGQRSRESGCR